MTKAEYLEHVATQAMILHNAAANYASTCKKQPALNGDKYRFMDWMRECNTRYAEFTQAIETMRKEIG